MWGLIILLIGHYVFDYLCQSREIAENKSTNYEALQDHVTTYIVGMSITAAIVFSFTWGSLTGILGGICFAVFVGLIHGAQDWYIWRGYRYIVKERIIKFALDQVGKEYNTVHSIKYVIENKLKVFKDDKEYAEDKVFYDFIGLDALLHTITIVLFYWWFV